MRALSTWMRVLPLVGVLALAACTDSTSTKLRITDPWATPTPPGITVGAAFMSFVAPVNDRLVSARSPIAERVELHSMGMEGGLMHMRPLAVLDLPAGKPVTLEPAGTHFMFIGLKQPLQSGSAFKLQLQFEHAGEHEVLVQVRTPSQ